MEYHRVASGYEEGYNSRNSTLTCVIFATLVIPIPLTLTGIMGDGWMACQLHIALNIMETTMLNCYY